VTSARGLCRHISLAAVVIAALGLTVAVNPAALGAAGTKYYLAPNGSDASNCTDPSSPCKTFAKVAGLLKAGDTLELEGGTYQTFVSGSTSTIQNGNFVAKSSGTEASPITIKNYNSTPPVIGGAAQFGAWFQVSGQSYWTIQGLTFSTDAGEDILSSGSSSHITIQDDKFTNTGSKCTQGELEFNRNSFDTVQDNVFGDESDPSCPGNGDSVWLEGTDHTIVQDNKFGNASHANVDMIDLTLSSGAQVHSQFDVVRNNTFANTWGSGAEALQSTNVLIADNLFKGEATDPDQGSKMAIQIQSSDNIIRGNIVTDTGSLDNDPFKWGPYGMVFQADHCPKNCRNVENNYVYNNDLYGGVDSALFLSQRVEGHLTHNYFVNNAIFDNAQRGRNFACPVDTGIHEQVTFDTSQTSTNNEWSHFPNGNNLDGNLLLESQGAQGYSGLIRYTSILCSQSFVMSLAEIQKNYPANFQGNIESNPLFVNAPGGNFNLEATSPLIAAGRHLTTTTAAGTGSTTIPVQDAGYFFDGYGITTGDEIWVVGDGATQQTTVTGVDTSTNTLTVSSPVTFTAGDFVDLPYQQSMPAIGACVFNTGGSNGCPATGGGIG
jgi:hypothetical protein